MRTIIGGREQGARPAPSEATGRGAAGLALLGLVSVLVVTTGCDRKSSTEDAETEKPPASRPDVRALSLSGDIDLRELPESSRRELEYGDPRREPACRELFEPGGSVRGAYLPDRERPRLAVYGCKPEAYRESKSGRRYVAYRPEGKSGERDLRLVAYDERGARAWDYRLDRSNHGQTFAADFRESFVAPLPPHLVCVGTLWSKTTAVSCLDHDTGEPKWEGELDFWSGIPIQGYETALHAADLDGLTRRYPYSGVEMERVEFERSGGRGAFYATDGRRLFFAPGDGDSTRLKAYAFDVMDRIWQVGLPEVPEPGFTDGARARHELLALRIDDRLVGIDARDGRKRWSVIVGESQLSATAGPEHFYVMVHREEAATRLVALEPASGAVEWWGLVPTGILDVDWVGGGLYVRSVRAYQSVDTGD